MSLINRKAFLAVMLLSAAAIALNACSRPQEPLHKAQLVALGTMVDISIWGVDKERAEQAIAQVESELNDIHHQWHAWQPGPLTVINEQLASGKTFHAEPSVIEVLSMAKTLSQASDGLFNPSLGKLISLWGFHSDERPNTPPPDETSIKALLEKRPAMGDLNIDADTLHSTNPALQLDLGGFAKGYAIDIAIQRLNQLGINNAIVNAGGDLRAIGTRGTRPWRIGIRHPREAGIIASIETNVDESVFTSGDYERYFDYQGTRYHHIIDPRSGYPAQGTTSVTVIHESAATADAAATALLVAGPSRWQEIAKNLGIKEAMLVDKDMKVYMTADMVQRIHFELDPPPEIIVGHP